MLYRNDSDGCLIFADHVAEAVSWLTATPKNWRQSTSTASRNYEWALGASWDDCLRLARDGWEQGVVNVERAAAQVEPTNKTAARRYGVSGQVPDVPRFISGNPRNMTARGMEKAHMPTLHLIVNVNCSGAIQGAAFAQYGGAIAALVDQLENTRRRVELDVLAVNSHQGRGWSRCGWKVKRAADPLDLGAVAFSLAHPGAFRRFIFGMWERTPAKWETTGYGTVDTIKPRDAAFIDAESNAVLLDGVGISGAHLSANEINKRLRANVVKALGVDIFAEGED